jgi:hypothetical protein
MTLVAPWNTQHLARQTFDELVMSPGQAFTGHSAGDESMQAFTGHSAGDGSRSLTVREKGRQTTDKLLLQQLAIPTAEEGSLEVRDLSALYTPYKRLTLHKATKQANPPKSNKAG